MEKPFNREETETEEQRANEFAEDDSREEPTDWRDLQAADDDQIREAFGFDQESVGPVMDDTLVKEARRKMAIATEEDQAYPTKGMVADVEIAREVWAQREPGDDSQWAGGPEIYPAMAERIDQLMEDMQKSWTAEGREAVQCLLRDAKLDVMEGAKEGTPPSEELIGRMNAAEGFAQVYQNKWEEMTTYGESDRSTSASGDEDLGSAEGFQSAIGYKEGRLSDEQATALRETWGEDLIQAREVGPEAYAAKRDEIRQEADALAEWWNHDPSTDAPQSIKTAEEIAAVQERLSEVKANLTEAWQAKDSTGFNEGQHTLETLIETAEQRLGTAAMAAERNEPVAEVTEEWLAGAVLALEHANARYEAKRPSPQENQRSGDDKPDTATGGGSAEEERTATGGDEARGRAQSTDQPTAGDGAAASDTKGARDPVVTSERDESQAGPGSRRGWEEYQTEMYYDLMVRNKGVAEKFRSGETLTLSDRRLTGPVLGSEQERHVRAVAGALSDRTRWMTSEERSERAMAATEQMLRRETFKQEERSAERAYANWTPARAEDMSAQEILEVLNDRERRYFENVTFQIAKNLEMAADPNVKWNSKDAAKAIRQIMKAAEKFAVGEGIVDKNGWMLRTARPRAESNGGASETGGANTDQSQQQEQRRQQNQEDDSARASNAQETGVNQETEPARDNRRRTDKWDRDALREKLAEMEPREAVDYVAAMIQDEFGKTNNGPEFDNLLKAQLVEDYRGAMWQAIQDLDQGALDQRVEWIRSEARELRDTSTARQTFEVTADSAEKFAKGGDIAESFEASLKKWEDLDDDTGRGKTIERAQRNVLDNMYQMSELNDGSDDALEKLSVYANVAAALDVATQKRLDLMEKTAAMRGDGGTTEWTDAMNAHVGRPEFIEKVLKGTRDDPDWLRDLQVTTWEVYDPMIRMAQSERSRKMLTASLKEAQKEGAFMRGLEEAMTDANYTIDLDNPPSIAEIRAELASDAMTADRNERLESKDDGSYGRTQAHTLIQQIRDNLAVAAEQDVENGKPTDRMLRELETLRRLKAGSLATA